MIEVVTPNALDIKADRAKRTESGAEKASRVETVEALREIEIQISEVPVPIDVSPQIAQLFPCK